MARYIHGAAARLEGAANTLQNRSIDDLIEEMRNFARARPAVFFGGAIIAGLALTRFLKSSGQGADDVRRQADGRGQ
jgi:hypothetical protein